MPEEFSTFQVLYGYFCSLLASEDITASNFTWWHYTAKQQISQHLTSEQTDQALAYVVLLV